MNYIEQKRQELQIERDNLLEKIEAEVELVRLRYKDSLTKLDAKIEFATEVLNAENELKPSKSEEITNGNSVKKNKSIANLFKPKGEMTVREGILKALKESSQSMSLGELMPVINQFGIDSSRKTVQARAAKMVGKDIERIADGVYKLIEK